MTELRISTGEPSTLKTYRKIAGIAFPRAIPMLDRRIAAYGEDEVVTQDERQMIYLMAQIEMGNAPADPAVIFTKSEIERAYGSPKEGE